MVDSHPRKHIYKGFRLNQAESNALFQGCTLLLCLFAIIIVNINHAIFKCNVQGGPIEHVLGLK